MLTLFPEMFGGVLGASMLGRAADAGLLEFFCTTSGLIPTTGTTRRTTIRLAAAPDS